MNVYYSDNVIGKRKYMNIKRASKAPGIPGLALYKDVAKKKFDQLILVLYLV